MNVRLIFLLVLATVVLTFFTVNVTSASAQSNAFSISSSGNLTLHTSGFDYTTTANLITGFTIYRGTYPAQIASFGVTTNNYTGYTIRDIINDNYASTTCTFISTSINCNLNTLFGTPVAGDYWATLFAEQNGNPINTNTWYKFTYTGTQWIPSTVFALTGVSRIISESPTEGLVATTAQVFTATIENATPNITKACIVIQRVDDVASYNPIIHCEQPNITGSFTFGTTTDLSYEASYLIRTELYSTSTTTPFITGVIRNVTAGAYLWSSIEADLAAQGATPIDDYCQGFENNVLAFYTCKITYRFFTIPTTVINSIYSSIYGRIQQIPPISWFVQIQTEINEMQYTTNIQEGITVEFGFDQQLTFLDPEDFNTWTGGQLSTIRFITTSFMYLMFLLYLINRLLYRMI